MAEQNVDDELLYKDAIAAAIVTVASSKIITARKRSERRMMWMREITFQRRSEYGAAVVRLAYGRTHGR